MTPDRWSNIDRIFHAALERTPSERAAFLGEACLGDSVLQREVESLLRYEPGVEAFLESPALHQEAASLAAGVKRSDLQPEIPGFTILKTLGEGGMGIVYLAEQQRPIHRQVALKLIKYGMDTRQVLARFEAERQALALMHHPHIASVHDAGTTADGRPYFVMEYVEGEAITEYCDRRRLTMRARLQLFVEVCGAVQHAHQKGIIHRDLKPSNVIVADSDSGPLPKIIDFGVARAADRSRVVQTAYTEQGMMIGTPEYMSPEQAALSPDVDTTTDVYSLGVLLYELLVGTLPFDSAQLRAAGFDGMRRIIRESDPERPSSRLTGATSAAQARQTDAGRLSRQLRGDLDWIVLKALEKDRRRRYATVAALAADVSHYLADEPIAARAPSAAYRIGKFARRYRGIVAAAATVLVVLLGGLIASLSQYARAESQRVDANRQRVEADRQRAQADQQREVAVAAAADAANQRNAALAATDDADRQRLVAANVAADAIRAREETEYRAYASSLVAADGELRLGFAAAARDRLLAVPERFRGWEWQHLFFRTDTSLATADDRTPCDLLVPTSQPQLISDNVLTFDRSQGVLYRRRCSVLQKWDRSGTLLAAYTLPGTALAIGPVGEALVWAVGDSRSTFRLRLVDPASGKTVQEFGSFEARPVCGTLSADGHRLAVGWMPDFTVLGEPNGDVFDVWDVDSGKRLATLKPPVTKRFDTRKRFSMSCMLAFSPDGTKLASSGGTIRIWQWQKGVELAVDESQVGTVAQPIAWNRVGSQLAIGRPDGLVDVLDVSGAPRIDRFDGNGFYRDLPIPPGDLRIAVMARSPLEVLSLSYSDDGTRILTGSDRTLAVWSVADRRLSLILAGHPGQINGIADAGAIWSADTTGAMKSWSPVRPGATTKIPGVPLFRQPTLSANGAVVASVETDGGLYAWQLADLKKRVLRAGTGVIERTRPLPPGEPTTTVIVPASIALSADAQTLFEAADDPGGTVRVWNMSSGTFSADEWNAKPEPGCENKTRAVANSNSALRFPIYRITAAPDARFVAFEQSSACLVIRDTVTAMNVAVLRDYLGSSFRGPAHVFRPDGRLLLVNMNQAPGTNARPRVQIWDWRQNRILADIPAPDTPANPRLWQVAISADGHVVALISGEPTSVVLWDGDLRRELGRLPVPSDTKLVALSADGSRAATVGRDMTVRIWDTHRQEQLLALVDDDTHERALAFMADGRLIADRSTGGFTIWESARTKR